MIEKNFRQKKKELKELKELNGSENTLPPLHWTDSVDLQHRLGAVAFEEHISEEDDDDDTNIFSLETLRNAFANIADEHQEEDRKENRQGNRQENRQENRNVENEEEPDNETFFPYDSEVLLPETEMISDLDAESEQTVELSPGTILEAMLFVGDWGNRPLSAIRAAEKMRNVSPEEIDDVVIMLNRDYQRWGCPYTIQKESEGYRMILRPEFNPILAKFYGKTREAKLSQQAIDTLSVVAYRQPISTEEVQKIRKQPSSALLNQLVRRGLLGVEREIRDKKKIMLYRTTNRFLELFQLDSIDDLPISEEIDFR
ncbi:MAG: SMC-Scp complex subunit ScpB [Planctomycetaceae bacterium]|jgi:segregation and condensation protein B|nr:SMC-Scp complex subunit ScpB [Planctomycetaceae bacterium]